MRSSGDWTTDVRVRPAGAVCFRRAGPADAVALRDLEQAANLAALGHIFPPERFPFPADDVLARWVLVLDDPDVVVEVVDGPSGLLAVSAYDPVLLRQLAVHPSAWGRGLARAAVERAAAGIAAGGADEARLWCLVENHRARGLYEHLGWLPGEERREAPWPPYPLEMSYVLPLR